MKKFKKGIVYLAMAISVMIGIVLVFNEPIKNMIVGHMQETALKKPIQKRNPKYGQFNNDKVKEVTSKDIAKAATTSPTDSIGKISIPAVDMKLPIFYGMSTNNMVRGACTMRPNEQMGMRGNYCLAGHHMMNNKILFGPLQNVRQGDLIYLTNGKNIYVYKVTLTVIVSEYQTFWINNIPNKNLITLITCASGHAGEVRRIVIRGELQKVQKTTKDYMKKFQNE